MKTEFLHLRMLLEGVEIPVVAAQITMRRNAPASAAIQIVPTPIAHMILPRSFVLLFSVDDTVPTNKVVSPDGTTSMQEQPVAGYEEPETSPGERVVPDVPGSYLRYKVCFMGEVIALSYVKTPGGRSVVLQCADLSNYWDCVMHDRRDGLFPPTRQARLGGMAQGAFFDLLGGDTGAMYDKLTKPPDCFPQLALRDENGRTRPSFLGGIMHLMEEVFGTYHRRVTIEGQGGSVIGSQNPFAAMAELRLRLLQQVGLPPEDSTPMKLLQTQGFGSIWRRSVRGLPAQFSFRTLMNALMQYTFYGIFPLSSPCYRPPEGIYARQMGWSKGGDEVTVPTASAGFPAMRRRLETIKKGAEELVEVIGGVDPWTGGAWRGVFPRYDLYATTAVREADTCRTLAQGDGGRWSELRAPAARLVSAVAQARTGVSLGWAGPAAFVISLLDKVIQACDVLLGLVAGSRSPRRTTDADGSPAFLYSQLMMPDIWFCAPPRCNVLFPELVSSINFSRNYLVEPTRLLVQGYSQFFGSDPLFDRWYFAPTSPGLLKERPIARSGGSVATGDSGLKNDLMAHELFTGIIPTFQKMSDREMTLGAALGGAGKDRDEISGESLDYFQRVVNFLFFKTRFASRSMSVSGIYNPRAVPGMPALVPDAPTDAVDTAMNEEILKIGEDALVNVPDAQKSDILTLLRGRTGTHYLGVLETVVHNLSATSGGTTEYVVSYARDHRESVELFGSDVVAATRRRKVYREAQRRLTTEEREVMGRVANNLAGMGRIAFAAMGPGQMEQGHLAGDPPAVAVPRAIGETLSQMAAGLAERMQRGVVTERQEVTSRTVTVAAFTAPQVGSTGPWGGPITAVEDVTDSARGAAPPPTAEDRQELAQLDRLITDVSEARDDARARAEREPTAAPALLATIASFEGEIAGYEARKSQISQRRQGSGPRRFVLFGTYQTGSQAGRRMPQAQIPGSLLGEPHPAREFGPDVISYAGGPDVPTTLRAYKLTEDISAGSSMVDFSLEDIVRPSWYPAVWDNSRIGGSVYRPLLGTTAITDPLAVIVPGGFEEALQAIREGTPHPTPGTDGASTDPIVGDILNGATVEGAVDFLVHTYSQVRLHGFDLTEFVRQYTWRPIATMFDLLGSGDLEIAGDGTITRGVEGFFSRAFGPYSDLYGIAPADTVKLLGVEEEDVAARARLDVRGQRYAVAAAYQQELSGRLLNRG